MSTPEEEGYQPITVTYKEISRLRRAGYEEEAEQLAQYFGETVYAKHTKEGTEYLLPQETTITQPALDITLPLPKEQAVIEAEAPKRTLMDVTLPLPSEWVREKVAPFQEQYLLDVTLPLPSEWKKPSPPKKQYLLDVTLPLPEYWVKPVAVQKKQVRKKQIPYWKIKARQPTDYPTRSWTGVELTPREFERKYGPFETPLGLPENVIITGVRRTQIGYELQYTRLSPYDVASPYGLITEADVKALEKKGQLFTAYMAERIVKGAWTPTELSPKEFEKTYGLPLNLAGDIVITHVRQTPTLGYEVQYMAKEEWAALPAYVREHREPGFWEVPLYQHLIQGEEKLRASVSTFWKNIMGWTEEEAEKYQKGEMIRRYSPIGAWARESPYEIIGMIKSAEATVGTVELLTGRPSVRSYIPTATGVITAEAVSILPEFKIGPFTIGRGGWSAPTGEYLSTYWESTKEHPQMLIGELYFEILAGLALSKGLEKAWVGGKAVWRKLPRRVTAPVEQTKYALTQTLKQSRLAIAYEKALLRLKEISPFWKGMGKDIKTPQLVGIKGVKTGLPVAFGYGEQLIKTFPETIGEAVAREAVWGMMQTPKTAAWIIAQAAEGTGFRAIASGKVLQHLIFRGGQLSIGYLQQLSWRRSIVEATARQRRLLLQVNTLMGRSVLPIVGAQVTSQYKQFLETVEKKRSWKAVETPKVISKQLEAKTKVAKELFKVLPSFGISVYTPKLPKTRKALPLPEESAILERRKVETDLPEWVKWKGGAFPSIYEMTKLLPSIYEMEKAYPREKQKEREREIPIPRLSLLFEQEEKRPLTPISTLIFQFDYPQVPEYKQWLIPPTITILPPKIVPSEPTKLLGPPIIRQIAPPTQKQPPVLLTPPILRQPPLTPPYPPIYPPTQPPTAPPTPPFRGPEAEAWGRRGFAALLSQWFYKRHPIMAPSQVAKHMLGRQRKKSRGLAGFIMS